MSRPKNEIRDFFANIFHKGEPVDPTQFLSIESDCLHWVGPQTFRFDGQKWHNIHALVWHIAFRPIPPHVRIYEGCGLPNAEMPCVNPLHLRVRCRRCPRYFSGVTFPAHLVCDACKHNMDLRAEERRRLLEEQAAVDEATAGLADGLKKDYTYDDLVRMAAKGDDSSS